MAAQNMIFILFNPDNEKIILMAAACKRKKPLAGPC